MRTIFINAKLRSIEEIEHTGKLKDIYETIGCDIVECVPMRNDEPNDLWIDEEGRLKDARFGFRMVSVPVFGPPEFCGNALIFSSDSDGELIPPTILIEDVLDRVRFWRS